MQSEIKKAIVHVVKCEEALVEAISTEYIGMDDEACENTIHEGGAFRHKPEYMKLSTAWFHLRSVVRTNLVPNLDLSASEIELFADAGEEVAELACKRTMCLLVSPPLDEEIKDHWRELFDNLHPFEVEIAAIAGVDVQAGSLHPYMVGGKVVSFFDCSEDGVVNKLQTQVGLHHMCNAVEAGLSLRTYMTMLNNNVIIGKNKDHEMAEEIVKELD